jgi:hypothetical protein
MALQLTVKICSTYRTKVEADKKKVFERAVSWAIECSTARRQGPQAQIFCPAMLVGAPAFMRGKSALALVITWTALGAICLSPAS